MSQEIQKHDFYYLRIAKAVSMGSKDPSTKVGAVLVSPAGRVISTGRNGFVSGVPDSPELYANRKFKLDNTIHAEMNALIFAHRDLTGSTIYVWPWPCCASCALHLVQAGVARFVSPYSDEPRWQESWELARQHIARSNRQQLEIDPALLPFDLQSA